MRKILSCISLLFLLLQQVSFLQAQEKHNKGFLENISRSKGDTWQDPFVVNGFPFEHTPDYAGLTNDYILPGSAADGPDAVYKIALYEAATITASVTGTNGKIAIYTDNFSGEEGPGPNNHYVGPPAAFFYDFATDCLATDFVIFDRDTQDNSNLGIDYNFQYSAVN